MNARAEHIQSQLIQIGDSIAAACVQLARDTTPDGCEILSQRLVGVARQISVLGFEITKGETTT